MITASQSTVITASQSTVITASQPTVITGSQHHNPQLSQHHASTSPIATWWSAHSHCKRSGSLPLQALGQPTIASARAAYHCKHSGSLPLQALGLPTIASARAAYHCKRSGSLPLQALGRPTTASARAAYLVVLQCLDELLAGLEQHDPGASVPLALKLHPGPGGVQLLQRLLHAQLLRGLVHNVAHLALKVAQVQSQQVCQVGLL